MAGTPCPLMWPLCQARGRAPGSPPPLCPPVCPLTSGPPPEASGALARTGRRSDPGPTRGVGEAREAGVPCRPSPRQGAAGPGGQGGSCRAVRGLRTPATGMPPGPGLAAGMAPRGEGTGRRARMCLTSAPGKTPGTAPRAAEGAEGAAVEAGTEKGEAGGSRGAGTRTSPGAEDSSGPELRAWAHQMNPSGLTMTGVTPSGPLMTTTGHPMTQNGPQMSLSGPQTRAMTTNGQPMTAQALLPGQPMTARMRPPLAPGKTRKADQV